MKPAPFYTDSTQEDDPLITVLVIRPGGSPPLRQDRAAEISQLAVNWLQAQGYCHTLQAVQKYIARLRQTETALPAAIQAVKKLNLGFFAYPSEQALPRAAFHPIRN
jgi:hypothetical protein